MINETSGYQVLLRNIALTGIYFLIGQLSLRFAINSGHVTLIYLPAGLALASLLLGGLRYIPGIFFGALAMIVKTPSLSSKIVLSILSRILTLHWLEFTFGIFQL